MDGGAGARSNARMEPVPSARLPVAEGPRARVPVEPVEPVMSDEP